MYHISSHIIRIGKLGVNSWVNAVFLCGYALRELHKVYKIRSRNKNRYIYLCISKNSRNFARFFGCVVSVRI